MKIVVTGGSGFIGAAFAKAAVEAGHDVSVICRDPAAWRLRPISGRFRPIVADISDRDAIPSALNDIRPDAVVHLAWAGVAGRDRDSLMQVDNIGWSVALYMAAREAGATHFVSTGSQAEYGPKSGIISPGDSTTPTTLYGEAKLATFRLIDRIAAQDGPRLSWIRVFSTYGAGDHPYWMIPGLIKTLLDGQRPSLTKGEQMWDLLHVSDAAAAILTVTTAKDSSGVYNLGSGSAPELRQSIESIRDAIDPSLPLGFGDVSYRSDQVMHLQADTTRLAELGWKPAVALADGLPATVEWYRSNPWIFGEGR